MSGSKDSVKCILCGKRTKLWNTREAIDEVSVLPGVTLFLDGPVCKWEFGSEAEWRSDWGFDGLLEGVGELLFLLLRYPGEFPSPCGAEENSPTPPSEGSTSDEADLPMMRDDKEVRQRLEVLRGQLLQWGTPDLRTFVVTKDELRGWIRALEWVLR